MSPEQARISVSAEAGVRILRMRGTLGVAETQERHRIASELSDAAKDIRVEWSEVSQMPARILQMLLVLVAQITAATRSLVVRPLSPEAAIYLRIAGFEFLADGVLSR